MSTTRDHLIAARDFLAQGFCKEALAFTRDGVAVRPSDDAAAQWCAMGALMRTAGLRDNDLHILVDLLTRELTVEHRRSDNEFLNLVRYNNHPETTQADMVALFDRIIAKL